MSRAKRLIQSEAIFSKRSEAFQVKRSVMFERSEATQSEASVLVTIRNQHQAKRVSFPLSEAASGAKQRSVTTSRITSWFSEAKIAASRAKQRAGAKHTSHKPKRTELGAAHLWNFTSQFHAQHQKYFAHELLRQFSHACEANIVSIAKIAGPLCFCS